MRVVLATANVGKQREFAALMAPLGFELVLQSTLSIEPIEETGNSFEANALLKARHAAHCAQLPALADDSGIEVDALEGRPGVYSARFAGPDATDAQNNARLLAELDECERAAAGCSAAAAGGSPAPAAGAAAPDFRPESWRAARYRCVLALVRSATDTDPLLTQGTWEGHIARQPAGTGGFGYDPYFIPAGLECTAAQLSAADKNARSHRAAALRSLVARLTTWP